MLTLDCNFGAQWCHTAKKLYDEKVGPFKKSAGIQIWCATDRNETVDWGEYGRKWQFD